MKLYAIIIYLMTVLSYIDATCDSSTIGMVLNYVITGPQELIDAILTNEDLRTPNQIALIDATKAEIINILQTAVPGLIIQDIILKPFPEVIEIPGHIPGFDKRGTGTTLKIGVQLLLKMLAHGTYVGSADCTSFIGSLHQQKVPFTGTLIINDIPCMSNF